MRGVERTNGTYERADYYCHTILPAMKELREAADHCEIIVAKDYWPIPNYSEILFYI